MRLLLLATVLLAASAHAQSPPDAALRNLGLPDGLLRVATGSRATALRELGVPTSQGMGEASGGVPAPELFYRRVGRYRLYVTICSSETVEAGFAACRHGSVRARRVAEVVALRPFAAAAEAVRFRDGARDAFRRAARRVWVECDREHFDLAGGATVSVTIAGGHPTVLIEAFGSPPLPPPRPPEKPVIRASHAACAERAPDAAG